VGETPHSGVFSDVKALKFYNKIKRGGVFFAFALFIPGLTIALLSSGRNNAPVNDDLRIKAQRRLAERCDVTARALPV
jgi:hypothetical protein